MPKPALQKSLENWIWDAACSVRGAKQPDKALRRILELLEAEGYPHVWGEAIERQSQEVLTKADLRAFLARKYTDDGITPQEIEAVINQLEAYSAADLYESNKAIIKLVCDGFLLKREDHTQKGLYIQLIDYSGLVAFRDPTSDQVLSIVAEDEATYADGLETLETNAPDLSF